MICHLYSFLGVSWFVLHRCSLACRLVGSSARRLVPLSSSPMARLSCILVLFCRSVALLSLMTVKKSSSVEKALFSSSPSMQQRRNCKKTFCFYIFRFLYFSTVPGNWSSWGEWSPCSKTCGNGTSTRRRACNNPAPAFGGAACVGATEMSKDCSEQLCPGQLVILLHLQP